MLEDLNNKSKILTENKTKVTKAQVWFYCEKCDYKSERKATLKKPITTNHPEGTIHVENIAQHLKVKIYWKIK